MTIEGITLPPWSVMYVASSWTVRLVMLFYVPQRRTPAAARTWLLLIFLLPLPGLAVYWFFGRIYVPRRRRAMQARASQVIRTVQEQMRARAATVEVQVPEPLQGAATLAARLGDFECYSGNHFELIEDYEASIGKLIADIDTARLHVHLLYYIFADDATGHRVAEALIRAASRGVKCIVLADAIGSKRLLRRGLARRLRAAGVEVQALLPVGFLRRNAARFDLRNHRKLAVVDGKIGYTGSQNIAGAEFIKGCPNEELVLRVTGPVVGQLQAVFVADHYFETNDLGNNPVNFPELAPAGDSIAQVLPSGPGYPRENAREFIIAMIYGARKRVVITTPYFVPDEPFMLALTSAAERGVEVHLIFSFRSNQPITKLAQESYYEDLMSAGVRIHLYQPGFLHAKHLTIDDDVALIGSTNIDIRSFALNAEVSLLIYDASVVKQLRAVQERYFRDSQEVAAEQWSRRSTVRRTAQNLARLADSFL